MTRPGYAIVSPVDPPRDRHRSLTCRLGCSHTRVDVYRTGAGGTVDLPARPEQLCVPGTGDATVDGERPESRSPLVLVPAGTSANVGGGTATTWLVVSAPVDAASGGPPVTVGVEDLAFEEPATSDVETARLTGRLGCRGMKANVRRLEPGQAVPYHTEGTQEELFVPLDGAGLLRVDGETHPVEPGSVSRVAPDVPRSAVNQGGRTVLWLMVGAPPTGDQDEWDPGVETLEWPVPDS